MADIPDRPDRLVIRLDRALVDRGLARSRGQAQELLKAGAVEVDGVRAVRAATPVTPGQSVRFRLGAALADSVGEVGRGYRKLAHALKTWPAAAAAVSGSRCLDAGASTGGFTQALLEGGAGEVVALDVGHGQLDRRLRLDPRVVDRCGTNLRDVGPDQVGGLFDVVVADLSFISLTMVMSVLRDMCRPSGQAIILVKPQFEVGRDRLGHSGVVGLAAERARAVTGVADAAIACGWGVADVVRSPLPGGAGNQEYLLWLIPPGPRVLGGDTVRSRVWAAAEGESPDRMPP